MLSKKEGYPKKKTKKIKKTKKLLILFFIYFYKICIFLHKTLCSLFNIDEYSKRKNMCL